MNGPTPSSSHDVGLPHDDPEPVPGSSPADPEATDGLAVAEVDRLRALGAAEPLLTGHRPVPVRYRDRWWHLPEGLDRYYRPAPRALAEVFEARRERLRAAAAAIARQPGGRGRAW